MRMDISIFLHPKESGRRGSDDWWRGWNKGKLLKPEYIYVKGDFITMWDADFCSGLNFMCECGRMGVTLFFYENRVVDDRGKEVRKPKQYRCDICRNLRGRWR